jgi:hypothetical protein
MTGGGRLGRFGNLEPERRPEEAEPSRQPSVEDRFAARGPAEADEGGGEDEGPALVRCALCRADSEATAEACSSCGASFSTPEQRTFNEALEKQRLHVRASRARAEAEAAEARRRREERLREQVAARRAEEEAQRTQAESWSEQVQRNQESFRNDPVGHVAREVGRTIGGGLGRLFPSPLARLAFVLGSLTFVILLAWFVPAVRALLCFGAFLLMMLIGALNTLGRFTRR